MSKKRKRNPALETFLDWVESIVFAVFGVIFLFTFVFRIAIVHGISMNDIKTYALTFNMYYGGKSVAEVLGEGG